MPRQKILDYLKTYKNLHITLGKLEQACPGSTTYAGFAGVILALEEQGILKKIAAAGENHKEPALANKYAIKKDALKTHRRQIKELQLSVHPRISLDRYYRLSAGEWHKDLEYVKKIDSYLKGSGVPEQSASMPQRSYELAADEKWLETGGLKVLERLDILDLLKIETAPDPLMLTIAPKNFRPAEYANPVTHLHLAVENKTTYYALADILCQTGFTSLIYGAGWKIAANLACLPKQLNLPDSAHQIYYFGDLDVEGIRIWWSANERIPLKPAVPFYRLLLTKQAEPGKQNQRPDARALEQFLAYFNPVERQTIIDLLSRGRYYPQEALTKDELVEIWSSHAWTTS